MLLTLVVALARGDLRVLQVALVASLVDARGTDRRVSRHVDDLVV